MYVLVLGLDVLGNPFGLIRGLSEGVEALFYEPFQGAVQGPEEFAEGLVIGVRSLVGHTVGAYDQHLSVCVITALKCVVYGKQVVICSKREFTFLINL